MKILINGETVADNGNEIGLADNNRLGIVVGEDVLTFDCDVSAFIALAERIGRDELWLKLCAMQLKEMR